MDDIECRNKKREVGDPSADLVETEETGRAMRIPVDTLVE